MLKRLGIILGSAIAGIFVMSVWGAFASAYGIGGGWFAGFIIIGPMWYMNHYLGILSNEGAWIDMALGIGVAGTMRDVFLHGGQAFTSSLPTLILVIAGGITGGITAAMLEKHIVNAQKEEDVA